MANKNLPSFSFKTAADAEDRIKELTTIYLTCLQESSSPKFKPPPKRLPHHIKCNIKLRNYYR
ncbi:hypothetical protein CDAR_292531, partial [Caerostris darwini]